MDRKLPKKSNIVVDRKLPKKKRRWLKICIWLGKEKEERSI